MRKKRKGRVWHFR